MRFVLVLPRSMQRVPHHIHAGQTHDLALFQPDLVHTVIVLSGDLLDVVLCVPSLLCSAWGL